MVCSNISNLGFGLLDLPYFKIRILDGESFVFYMYADLYNHPSRVTFILTYHLLFSFYLFPTFSGNQNLLRTDDGKLCILDFGMTLDTPEGLQYPLLEVIAHLASESYDAIPKDLVNLQFL